MRKGTFEEKERTIKIEYDVSRLALADIAALVHGAGIDAQVLVGDLETFLKFKLDQNSPESVGGKLRQAPFSDPNGFAGLTTAKTLSSNRLVLCLSGRLWNLRRMTLQEGDCALKVSVQ